MAIPKAGEEPLPDMAAFLAPFAALVRRSESRVSLERYTTGLLSDLVRKTSSDMGRALPGTSSQALQEFLTNTAWDPGEMDMLRIDIMLSKACAGEGVLIIDDTGFPKKGRHSVGVARQYSGTLGRVDNCQILVSAHYVDRIFDWPVSGQLYLPEIWSDDLERRRKAHVPTDIAFKTKGRIALDLIDMAQVREVPIHVVNADAGYEDQPTFLDGLAERDLAYIVGVGSNVMFRVADEVDADPGPPSLRPRAGRGRPLKASRLEDRVPQRSVADIVNSLPKEAWSAVAWREGSRGSLVKEFARIRVYRTGLRASHIPTSGWLFSERPLPGKKGDRKYYFANGLDHLGLDDLVGLAHVRWVIERYYQDAKGELGLDDYEGRLWHGFHRHVALVMLAHSYLTLRQSYGPEVLAHPPTEAEDRAGRASPLARAFPPRGSQKHPSASCRTPASVLSTSD
jgi:SRSO17 transposase